MKQTTLTKSLFSDRHQSTNFNAAADSSNDRYKIEQRVSETPQCKEYIATDIMTNKVIIQLTDFI